MRESRAPRRLRSVRGSYLGFVRPRELDPLPPFHSLGPAQAVDDSPPPETETGAQRPDHRCSPCSAVSTMSGAGSSKLPAPLTLPPFAPRAAEEGWTPAEVAATAQPRPRSRARRSAAGG